jgi:carboxymethylenebutenolidase
MAHSKNIAIHGAEAYHVFPDDGSLHPGLIVLEEIWGLNDQIRGVADRFAAAGFSVLAPELIGKEVREALTPDMSDALFDPERRDALQPRLRAALAPLREPEYARGAIEALQEALDYLIADEWTNGKAGVLGFCFGGTYVFHLATKDPRLGAAVPFYGQPPRLEDVPKIGCPILAFYGDEDEALMETLPVLQEAMDTAGKRFEAVVYPGAGHAFFNETNERMYRPQYAEAAWEKSLAFLTEELAR